MVPSSGSSRWRSPCAWHERSSMPSPARPAACWTARATSSMRRSRSSGSWRTGSTRRFSPIAASAPPSTRSPSRAPLPVAVGELPSERLPEQIELAAYFVVSEALTNVAKYASASEASVTVTKENGRLRIEVSDDGVGGADLALGHRPPRAHRPPGGDRGVARHRLKTGPRHDGARHHPLSVAGALATVPSMGLG